MDSYERQSKNWWKQDEQRAFALSRLAELKVAIQFKEDSLTLWVPHTMENLAFIEIGYLIAQLGDEDYPKHFYKELSEVVGSKLFDSDPDSRVYLRQPLEYRDSAPHGMKLHLYLEKELKRLTESGRP